MYRTVKRGSQGRESLETEGGLGGRMKTEFSLYVAERDFGATY
jgi:hypothetical protein